MLYDVSNISLVSSVGILQLGQAINWFTPVCPNECIQSCITRAAQSVTVVSYCELQLPYLSNVFFEKREEGRGGGVHSLSKRSGALECVQACLPACLPACLYTAACYGRPLSIYF